MICRASCSMRWESSVPIGVNNSRPRKRLPGASILSASANVCMDLVGHTSLTGSAAFNDKLSQQRAGVVKERLEAATAALRGRLAAHGKGSAEPLVGTGTDDARDALDRRVEFKIVDCPAG